LKLKINFFWEDFLDFSIFYLILGLSLHIHPFFSSLAALAGPQSGIFELKKNRIFCLFLDLSTVAGVTFFDKNNPPPLFLIVKRG
jgi:hypothetical protein